MTSQEAAEVERLVTLALRAYDDSDSCGYDHDPWHWSGGGYGKGECTHGACCRESRESFERCFREALVATEAWRETGPSMSGTFTPPNPIPSSTLEVVSVDKARRVITVRGAK